MMVEVKVQNLGKYFGSIKAVDDISFSVQKGEVLGFLGPNGAGKSTTMKMLSCFLSPDFGNAWVNNFSILDAPMDVKKNLGYLPENAPAYEEMTVEDFLNFVSSVRRLAPAVYKSRLDYVNEIIGLKTVRSQIIGTLSKGFKRRVGLAQAIIHDPKVLILDEPTDGLDPNQKFEVRQLIKTMAADKVIIISTHILEEVDEVCSRAIIISNGKIVADGTPLSLRKMSRFFGMVELILNQEEAQKALQYFQDSGRFEQVELGLYEPPFSRLFIFPKKDEEILESLIIDCQKQSWKILSIVHSSGNLAEVFRKITQGEKQS